MIDLKSIPQTQPGDLVALIMVNKADRDIQTSHGLITKGGFSLTYVRKETKVLVTSSSCAFEAYVGTEATVSGQGAVIHAPVKLSVIFSPSMAGLYTSYEITNQTTSPVTVDTYESAYRGGAKGGSFMVSAGSKYPLSAPSGTELRIASSGYVFKEANSGILVMEYNVSGTPKVATIVKAVK